MTDSPIILAIETATANCSVSLCLGSNVHERAQSGNNIHSKVLLDMVQDVLESASLKSTHLDAVAVGQGPGSFTGLRIGVGIAQGIAYGAGCSMIGVSSLAALVEQAQTKGFVLAAIDARMNEVYWGLFSAGAEPELIGELQVSAPDKIDGPALQALSVDLAKDSIYLVGNAWSEYTEDFDQTLMNQATRIEDCLVPTATGVLEIARKEFSRGDVISPADFSPVYVRNNVAAKKKSNS